VHVVGVAYKPGVADVRESPALEIIEHLADAGARVTFDDPLVDSVRIGDRVLSRSRTAELDGRPDLVLVHTRPVGMDLTELAVGDAVLDATFELRDLEHREVV
jgi:UDP-N-acetyl-D-mannosaminuronate dehydrogenase